MVKNLWKQVLIVCGNHGEPENVMSLKTGHRSMFYSCPKYYPEAREPGERACKNHVSVDDFEKILGRLSKEVEELMISGQKPCLKNLKYKVKTIEVEVMKHSDNCLVLKVLNKKALQ